MSRSRSGGTLDPVEMVCGGCGGTRDVPARSLEDIRQLMESYGYSVAAMFVQATGIWRIELECPTCVALSAFEREYIDGTVNDGEGI